MNQHLVIRGLGIVVLSHRPPCYPIAVYGYGSIYYSPVAFTQD